MKGNVVGPPGGFTYLVSSSLAEEVNILLCTHEVCSPIPHGSSTVRFTTNQTVLLGSDKFKVERERERERERATETATELPMAHTKHTILPTTSDWEKAKKLHSRAHSLKAHSFSKNKRKRLVRDYLVETSWGVGGQNCRQVHMQS
jgi:hypothetical protein